MAKPKVHKVGGELETTIIFTPKTVIEELAKARRDTKKRTQSMSGTLGEKIGKAVEENHLDRKAFSLACQLDSLDDERLHITWHNLLKYAADLGIVKRAAAQEELFDPNASDEEPEGKVVNGDASGGEKDAKARGSGPRLVPEGAGSADKTH